MPLDDAPHMKPQPPDIRLGRRTCPNPRVLRGAKAYASGRAAEQAVKAHYLQAGFEVCEERWRGKSGEVDLIFSKDAGFIFVEVKSSKTCVQAAQSLSQRQLSRIYASANDYVSTTERGLLSDMRIDAALVDASGHIEVLENVSL